MRDYYPLSKTEEGIYVECTAPTDAYNLTNIVNLGKGLDVARFTSAVEKTFAAHPYLFTVLFEGDDGRIYKKIAKERIEIKVVEEDELMVQSPPFEMINKHLYRLGLYLVKGEYYFVYDFHHIIFDGTSIKTFIDEVISAYDGKEIAAETYGANEYALEEEKRLHTDEYFTAKSYFERAIRDPETDSDLIEDKADGEVKYASFHADLDILNVDVKKLTSRLKIKTSAFFSAAFAYLLAKINMDDKALFLTVNNGRNEGLKGSFGMFVKTFPFYLENKETVSEYLLNANDYLVGSVANLLYPFSDLSADLGVNSGIMFAYQGDYFYKTNFGGRELYVEQLERKDGKGKLSVELHRDNGRFFVWVEYRSDIYEEETIRRLVGLYDVVLKEFLKKEYSSEIVLTDEKELDLLNSFNNADLSYIDDKRTVLDSFKDMVAKYPERNAVVFKDKRYTYREVDILSDKIAAFLLKKGIKKEDVVSVLINKSEYIVIASLGVIKSGAAYQPLDPSYPLERLEFMVKDAAAKAIIKDRDITSLSDKDIPVLFTDEIASLPEAKGLKVKVSPKDLFIMLYTSGSTGIPKGVMIEHSNINAFASYHAKTYEVNEESRVAAYASYGFDADMMDLYPTLTHGGCVYVIPNELRLDLIKLGDYFNENGITHAILTTQVGRQFVEMIDAKTLRYLMVGGEKLVPVDPPKYTLLNGYGPTEGTVYCSSTVVDKKYYRVPIGKANGDYKSYVLDKNGKRLPVLAQGELYIAGPQVARGYLNRDEENRKAFLVNPFDDDPKFKKMYRTGDVVRYLPDGTLDFIGRKDGQVKIRGFRVELSEVEKVVREFEGITDATVKDFTDPSGIKYICAYVVADKEIDVDKLNAFIASKKPPYMVPAYTMQIDSIPLNQNQKVNKRALPQPELKAKEKVAPESEDEKIIFDILSGILGNEGFGVTTDIYEAGLTSVTSIRFAILLSKEFGKEVNNADFRECPTIRSLAERLAGKETETAYDILSEYPLTKLQEGIFVECTTMQGTTVYNIPVLLKLDARLDEERLIEAVNKVIDAHPYVKMRIKAKDNGDVVATRDDERKIEIGRVKVNKGELDSLVKPFDLLKDDLFRASIIDDGENKYLFVDAHHIVFDGESLVVFMRELDEAYRGVEIEKEKYTGFEVALDEEKKVKSEAYVKAKNYYEELLGAVDVECMPIRDRDEGTDRGENFSVETSIDKNALSKFLADSGTTVNALWNAAFGFTLSKFLSREDCVYTTVYNGRSDTRTYNSLGMYVHTLPMVFRSTVGENSYDAVRKVAKTLSDDMANDVYPFAEISRNLGVKANIMFVYEGNIGSGITIDGIPVESVMLRLDALKADLSIFVFETEKGFRVDCEYNARYYEAWSMRSLVESTILSAQAMIKGETLDMISLLSADEKKRLDERTFVAKEVEDADIVTLFKRSAKNYPDNNAVIFRDKHISYKELDALTDRVAAYLQSKGIEKEDRVSVLVPRGEYMVIAALGVLKAGAAYEPLDPSYPPERLNFMVKNASSKLVIADEELIGLLSEYEGERLFIKDIESLPNDKPVDPQIKGENMFIILYTSGTTGTPKGVMLEHRNLVNFCAWYRDHYDLKPESVVGAYASFGFDADMMDLYPALTTGAAVYIIPEDMRLNLNDLGEAFEENKVTHVFMTTQMGRMFAENVRNKSLLHLSVGGETLAPVAPPKDFALWNGYGPTECTIFSTVCKIDKLYYRNPIGAALDNYRLYVVGKNGDELPVGALGELWISGAGVGRGYLDLPEQTKKVFIENPFSNEEGFRRAYRTGDVVRRLYDGSIDFVGRNDGQVKIRGFRIELSEVEGVIREYEGVKNVTVQAFEDKAFGGKFLAAYVVSDKKLDFNAIGEFIKSKKPPYMVPAAFMQLDSIPLNQNQKVNKRALPTPQRNAAQQASKDQPATELEREICKVFANILGLETIGATDDFFDMGGTSISAAKVAMYAANKNYPVAYKDIFDNPTARALAKHISSVSGEVSESAAEEIETKEESLKYNAVRFVNDISSDRPLGRTLIAGATGFLGSHILYELLKNKVETVALSRGSKTLDAKTRLSAMMMYYFDVTADDELGSGLTVIDGDITNDDLLIKLKDEKIDTIINAAACVKHFAADDTIERINVLGVENLIKVARSHGARLVQISTLSVAGENVDGKFPETFKMKENQLFFGQDISNKYVNSKFKAEKAILEAVDEGLDAKIIRVGNLMSRLSDGEFQVNAITNNFMRNLKGYAVLKKFPVNSLDATVDFTPIDEVAKAVLSLATVDKKFTVFHAANSHAVQMGDVIYAMNALGFGIEIVPDDVFMAALKETLADDEKNMLVSALINYASSDGKTHSFIQTDNEFTNKALYHLGFKWPITDERYLENAINALVGLNFFIRTDI